MSIDFGSPSVSAFVLRDSSSGRVDSRSVVVNLSDRPAFVEGTVRGYVPARLSTVVHHADVTGELLLVIPVPDDDLPVQFWRDAGWTDFYARDGQDATEWPVLLKSAQTSVGSVQLDSSAATGVAPGATERFEVRVNLWFSPAGTDCGIHNIHDFLEVHTQISGLGAMQKFRTKEAPAPYEEQFLAPGTTSPAPFCRQDAETYAYPWHQYRAVTDCLWLAVEYHRSRS